MNDNTTNLGANYLTFRLGQEMFALNVLQVREVLDLSPITRVPRAPAFMRGVINVRGAVVPVVDMRLKFGQQVGADTVDTRIVVMEVVLENESVVLGFLADAVHEVMEMEADQIEPPPRMGGRWRTDLIRGIGKHNDAFILILDVDRLFSTDELTAVAGGAEAEWAMAA